MWGVPGDPNEQVTMTRYYAVQRTFWVDPVSGTIVKQTEHANHYFSRDPLKPELTLADYKVTSNQDTVEAQVNTARDERDRLSDTLDKEVPELRRRLHRELGQSRPS